jgi:hypothetical protein
MKYCQFRCFWAWFDVKFYAELKKVYFMGSKVQSKVFGAQKRNLLVIKFLQVVWPIHRLEILCWAQKSILYGVWNATVMRAQKREIQISRVKNLIFSVKKLLSVWNWKSFLQLYSKLILKLVMSFMNRKSSCGYATHFF